jgi:tetratricopeptide (TPR) repeat protein
MLPYFAAESKFMMASMALSSASPDRYPVLLEDCEQYMTTSQQTSGKTSLQIYKARFHLENGEVKKAFALLNDTLANTRQDNDIYHQLFIYLYMGLAALADNQIDQALRCADRLEEMIKDRQGIKKLRYYYLLSGYISRHQDLDPEAINQFRMAESLLSKGYGFRDTALFYRALADTYYENQNYSEALRYYIKIIRLKFGRIHLGDVYRKALKRIIAVYEVRGQTGKANEYRTILTTLDVI